MQKGKQNQRQVTRIERQNASSDLLAAATDEEQRGQLDAICYCYLLSVLKNLGRYEEAEQCKSSASQRDVRERQTKIGLGET